MSAARASAARGFMFSLNRSRPAMRQAGSLWSRATSAQISSRSFKEVKHMMMYPLVFAIVIGLPVSGAAQFVNKGGYVEVKKGTLLCANVTMEQAKGALDPGRVFWKVTSLMRANRTQTVAAMFRETVYDRRSGDTRVEERRYDEEYATWFKRDPEHEGMLLMISPQDGQVEATVEQCSKRK
jgi:hypothetical protein